ARCGRACGARGGARGVGLRGLLRRPRGGLGPRHLADLRAEPADVLGRIAVRPYRGARLGRCRRGPRRDRERDAARHPQRAVLDAHVADHRRPLVAPPAGGALDDRRDDRRGHGPADAARPAHRLLGDGGRHLRGLEPDDPHRGAAGRPRRRCADVRPRRRGRRRLPGAAVAPAHGAPAGRGGGRRRRRRGDARAVVAAGASRAGGRGRGDRGGGHERAREAARMTGWHIILIASIAVLGLKLVGYLVPPSVLERPTPARVANLLTVALLAALTATQTLERAGDIVVDARVPAIVLAAVLFALRVPFILVVLAAAVCAALVRMLGWLP